MRAPRSECGPDADESLPEEVVDAIENGVRPLAAVRHFRGLSVEQLARLSGVSPAAIDQAERGHELSPEAQVKLAWALDVGADLFVD